MSSQTSSRAVTISYFDPFDVFESIKGEFLQIFPFQNIHWKSPGGAVRTVRQLPVNLVIESEASELNIDDVNHFVRFIVVNCISVDDYRGKVRPLLRQWLPVSDKTSVDVDSVETPKPIVLLYANSEVVDSNLFKSISLIDKFAKDFPGLKTLVLRSVYKSPTDREDFWNQMGNKIKSCLLDIFQKRLTNYRKKLSNPKNADEELGLREKILELYLAFNMHEEATTQLNEIRDNVVSKRENSLPNGELETPFNFAQNENVDDGSIAKMLLENKLTKFQYFKYFFVKRFRVLNMGKTNVPRLLQLYRLIRDFLHCIESIFRDSPQILEFKYCFIDDILKYINDGGIPIFLEMKAELSLLKRDCWVQGVLANTDFKLIDKSFPKSNVKFTFDRLKESYKDENTFHENFVKSTSLLLALYNKSSDKKRRIVDILSLEIGMLHYQRGEYEKAVSLFDSCYEYYMETGWDIIGLKIVQMYYDSLIHCPQIKYLKRDDEDVSVSIVLSNAFLNILRISKDEDEKRQIWKKFFELQKEMESPSLVYQTDGLFCIALSDLSYLSEANVYKIDVTIRNLAFLEPITADSIKLILKNSDDQFVEFKLSSVNFAPSTNHYALEATEISFGEFQPVSIEIKVGNATFLEGFVNENHPIFIEPLYHPENISCSVQQSKRLNLGEYAIDLIHQNVKGLESFAVEIMVEPNLGSFPISFSQDQDLYRKRVVDIKNDTTIRYFPKDSINSFRLKVKTSFTKKDNPREFSEIRHFTISCYLPLSVSVEDIFKKDAFIFKFLLNSSTEEEPIILYSSKLRAPENSERYTLFGDFEPNDLIYLTADPNESALNCYQVTTKDKFDHNDLFQLKVTYNTLKEQINGLVTDSIMLQGDMEWYQEFELWKHLWENKILPLFQYDYNAFIQSCTITTMPGTLNITDICDYLLKLSVSKPVTKRIIETLKKIVRGVELTDIDIYAYVKNLTPRTLIVPVELPQMDYFFYVEFSKTLEEQYQVGSPMLIKIRVENLSGKWGSQEVSDAFVLEVASSNEWLAHGKKRMLIRSEINEFELYVIPLKKGYLNYPRIEISSVETGVPTRIDNPNASETLLVL
ncbi:ZYRO0A06116p [Zygosaccharomyces rouxii]|uniref:ZYRO0A06116p n=1 Tax=Zygosaccharomyces rouxii (strain ATCC 2623 / CBS 732 / NBRC 1130 / NCYC 568 / NRRL Y-229) TaxID=559307 RepID=C5DPU2_ZYGRC|nr:uncharacterized protein ZYRO0A06116g [Zygosaccharomyces rouxii]KAH9198776.1 hypothetical protein LQ764DRAFT_141131 [Zygosaccharomyces rouxii]CAR25703.1 ZYRO0A06116p [Zygosaccharomyces rouxii]